MYNKLLVESGESKLIEKGDFDIKLKRWFEKNVFDHGGGKRQKRLKVEVCTL